MDHESSCWWWRRTPQDPPGNFFCLLLPYFCRHVTCGYTWHFIHKIPDNGPPRSRRRDMKLNSIKQPFTPNHAVGTRKLFQENRHQQPLLQAGIQENLEGHFPGARGIGEFLDTNCGVNHSSELSRDWSFIIYLAHAVHLFGCFWWIAQCMRRPYLRTQPQERHAECDWRQTTPPCNPEESRGFVIVCSLAVFAFDGFANLSRNIHGWVYGDFQGIAVNASFAVGSYWSDLSLAEDKRSTEVTEGQQQK